MVTAIVAGMLALDLAAILGLAYYTFFSDIARCWVMQDGGLLVGCGPHVPDWSWIALVASAVVLARILVVRVRTGAT